MGRKNTKANNHEMNVFTLGVHLSIFLFLLKEHISSSIKIHNMYGLNDKVLVWFCILTYVWLHADYVRLC